MKSRAERRNKCDNTNLEYQVFGVFKSFDFEGQTDEGDHDHRWMLLSEILEALKDRALIDGMVANFFGCLPAAHSAAMDLLLPGS